MLKYGKMLASFVDFYVLIAELLFNN